jgi:Fe-S cluster assembly protein SufD
MFREPPAPAGVARTAMGALAAALAPDPEMLVLFIAASPRRPIWLRFIAETPGAARLTRVAVVVGAGAAATLLETYEGAAEGFGSVYLEGRLHEGATLKRVVVQDAAPGAVVVSTADIGLAAGAVLEQVTLAFGAKLARLETHVTHDDAASRAILDGAYLLESGLHADLTTVVDHAAPEATTVQLVKGAVRDRATGVFQGRIVVERGAQKTDARMAHNALLLSEGATVNAKPELVIYADDVQCAHGNTAGALDADELFYLQARGVPEPQAMAMLTEGFVAEAFDRVADDGVKEILLGQVRAWLGRAR